jgi:uncharacterized protein with HEPN domain
VRDDRDFLQDILERIALTQEFTRDGRSAFMGSRMMQEAVIRNLEVIGEASRTISEGLRNQHPHVQWKQISAFRNFVIHVYWQIRLERIWEVVEKELDVLKAQIEAILTTLDTTETNNDEPEP